MMPKKPNLFIVGAPKCGTSFLYEYLTAHPQVFMCPVKEPNYFDKDLHYTSTRLSLDRYLTLFAKAASEKILGEASPWYLYSTIASKEIFEFNPEAKIIIMLRNPIDTMYSLHGEHLFRGNEIEEDFEKAISLEKERRRGINIHKHSNPAEGVYYKGIVSYFSQVSRYFEVFGRENVHIVIFDDLTENPEGVYKATLNFLNVNADFKPDLKVVNPAKVVKSKIVRELILRPPKLFRELVQLLVPIHSLRIYIQEKIIGFNSRKIKKRHVNPELVGRLKNEISLEITNLSELIGRDLTHWVRREG